METQQQEAKRSSIEGCIFIKSKRRIAPLVVQGSGGELELHELIITDRLTTIPELAWSLYRSRNPWTRWLYPAYWRLRFAR